jgi:hypothetical protein
MIDIAVVGAGAWGRNHLRVSLRGGSVEIEGPGRPLRIGLSRSWVHKRDMDETIEEDEGCR